ncbi:MAG: hypothetical protein FWF81_04365, partial [Defluviitaleaceae bacterium]|nr:hypothetical protein [Defluviitaleaceae bacterium]
MDKTKETSDRAVDLGLHDIHFEGLTEKEAREFKGLLSKFVKSYTAKSEGIADKDWLGKKLQEELPELSDEKAKAISGEIVESVAEYDANLLALNNACASGKSKESWFEEKTSAAATGMSVQDYGRYLQEVNKVIEQSNSQMMQTLMTKSGTINAGTNLHGYIAEQHYANTFNARAALENTNLQARVLPPSGTKNSVDIVIENMDTGKVVERYQAKSYADVDDLIDNLKEHNYNNQRLVVSPEHVDAVKEAFPGKTVTAHIGGTDNVPVKSDELSYDELKAMQNKVQEQNDVTATYIDYNTFNTKELALNLGKNAALQGMQAALITTGFTLAAKVFEGETIEGDKVVEVALKTGADAGVKAAATGALHAAIQKGIIKIIPKSTPVGMLANIVCVGIENIKILGKVAAGKLTPSQGLDHMGRTTTTMVVGLW